MTIVKEPVPLPVIIGVTGHRDIQPDAADTVKVIAAVREILMTLKQGFGPALHIITALADGADQLVADVAKSLGIDMIAVIPMPMPIYLTRVENKAKLQEYWSGAVLRLELPKTDAAGDTWSPGHDEHLYRQLGAFISRRSHMLLALWEGPRFHDPQEVADHPGGTADVVRMRFDVQHLNKACHESRLFGHAGSPLDTSHADPVLHIVTPRFRQNSKLPRFSGSSPHAGICYLLRHWSGEDSDIVSPPSSLFEALKKAPHKAAHGAFEQMTKLNKLLLGEIKSEHSTFEQQFEYVKVDDVGDTDGAPLHWLRCAQAGADAAAVIYQHCVHGHYVAGKLRHIPGHAAKQWLTGKRFILPSALFVFTAAVPLAVILFECFAHLYDGGAWMLPGYCTLALYLAWLVGVISFHYFIVKKGDWQNRFQDYRALAEALRVQLFWGLATVPIAASDNYLRKHVGELGWISFALRGPALWGTSLALGLKEPRREAIRDAWFEDQATYFIGEDRESGKAEANERALKRNRGWATAFFGLGISVAALLLLSDPHMRFLAFGCLRLKQFFCIVQEYHDIFTVAAATFPAIAAFLAVASNLRAYEAHAHNYRQMGQIFVRALDVAETISAEDLAMFKELVRDLGREALSENAEWLLDHRDRQVEAGP